ncbi:cholecystokinin receptor type A-like [Ptychodera flava]|uniref:cholecystokinin receptor type A-like n=1 Tax=Ptychodera flava TaxID=63121 RepID=UPI00396A1ED5
MGDQAENATELGTRPLPAELTLSTAADKLGSVCAKLLSEFCAGNSSRTAETMAETNAGCNFTMNDDVCAPDNATDDGSGGLVAPNAAMDERLSLVLYSLIFLLAVVGNILVIVTLVQNKRMRTVTNIFLLSLSVSDLLFALFCMPITIVGAILQNFIFGAGFCRILPYVQVITVFVSVWTMVTISMERYFAICRPLTSRGWQTKAHAYKMIAGVWVAGFVLFIPTAYYTKLTEMPKPHTYKCREDWPSPLFNKIYITLMFSVLMAIPLLVMIIAYALIILELWRGMRYEKQPASDQEGTKNGSRKPANGDGKTGDSGSKNMKTRTAAPRSTSNNAAKRRVVKMLIVVVVLFFVCWTPTWCLNMWLAFDRFGALTSVSPLDAAVVKLLTYISCCVNPITYCFMNKRFRQGFLEAFGCCAKSAESGAYSAVGSTRMRSTARNSPKNQVRARVGKATDLTSAPAQL